jgi:chemotaxis protein MotB
MKKGEVQVKQAADRLVVMMAEPLLFDVDDVEIAPDAEEILMRLGNVLKGTKNQQIMVGGHLDDTPIAAAMAKEFPTAWEFTGARAVSVVRFLEEEAPLSGRLLTAAAYGSSRPITSNTTDQGREQNRRLEVAILAPGG